MKESLVFLSALLFASCGPKIIHVSPGTSDSLSCASIREAIREAAAYSSAHKGRSIEIILADGEYELDGTIAIEGDEFTGPLTICAAEGESPILQGLKCTGPWAEVTDSYALRRIPDSRKVLQANLMDVSINDLGCAVGDENRLDLYFDGKRQIPAQWPNQGLTTAGDAIGTTLFNAAYMGDSFKEPLLRYDNPRIDVWGDEKEPFLHGYWCFDWFDMYNPVLVDKSARIMTIGGDESQYGYRSHCQFRGVNLLCELDAPGEYWLDRSSGHLFWYAPDNFDKEKDIDGSRTAVSSFSGKYVFVLDNCKDVTIKGLSMNGCRGGAILIKGGSGVTISGCNMHGFANDVITADGGYDHKITECTLSELGCAGIILLGGDRETLKSSGFEVTDCTIENISLYRKTYKPCIRFRGCGLLISHNNFKNSPSSALRLDGNDILVEHNHFENLVTESDDQGAIDIFNDITFRGIEISNNYFHNIGDPAFHWVAGVRFDDRISGANVLDNVFDHCGSKDFGAVQIHGGQDNLISGNLFFDCTMAISQSPWSKERWEKSSKVDCEKLGLTSGLDSLTEFGKLYIERYPDMIHILDTALVNVNYFKGNVIVKTCKLTNREGFIVFEDNKIIEGD